MKLILAILAALGLSACSSIYSEPRASASLAPTRGNVASGVVTFTQNGDAVLVEGLISGLKPNAEHGFHIHEKGDCSSGDGMSALGHFNPTASKHGAHGTGEHHTGDLMSLMADASGSVNIKYTTTSISVVNGATNIIGRGLIVHRDPDDFKTQPTGNSGPRLACAVIEKQ